MRLAASLLVILLACASPALAEKPSPTPAAKSEKTGKSDKEKKDKKDKKSDKDESDSPKDFDIPLEVGQDVKGIKVPNYGPDGKLIMLLDAEVARKIDENHIEMENLKIDAYGDDGKKFYIELPRSVFNLEDRILTGNEHVLIRRDDFEITGDTGEFQTKTRFAKVMGNVKMTIFNTENLQ